MKIILLGAPGAGKGTQSAILQRRLDIPAIATGHILRAAVKSGTPVGLKAKDYMDHGKLVPDEIIIDIVAERLAEHDCDKGYILDGAPRTIAQAEALEKAGIIFDNVILLYTPDEVIIERMSGRRTCEGCGAAYNINSAPSQVEGVCDKCGGALILRDDDKVDTVKHRLDIYHETTEPLVDFYEERGVLKRVHNQASIEETTRLVEAALGI